MEKYRYTTVSKDGGQVFEAKLEQVTVLNNEENIPMVGDYNIISELLHTYNESKNNK